MSWSARLKNVFRRKQADRELDEEVRGYFDAMVERGVANGLTPEEAERAAHRRYGSPVHAKEAVRDSRWGAVIDVTLQDLRYGLRTLRKNPGFAAIAVLSLGLGLGANTAIFTLVDTVLLRSLPVADPERLFFIDNSGGKSGGSSGPPYPCFELFRDNNQHFLGMAAFSGERFRVTIDGVQEMVSGQSASGSYFDLLGIKPAIGRVIGAADDSVIGRGGPDGAVAVISYRFWERRFRRDPAVLGKSVLVGTNWVTVVGVTSPGFHGLSAGSPVDITIPMALTGNNLGARLNWWFSVIGRLKDGAAPEQARAELDRYFRAYMAENGKKVEAREYFSGIALVPAAKGLEGLRRTLSKPLLIVMVIVALILLIGCANVANLLLARASARRNEIAMRLVIGASRGRIVRQLLTEGFLLAVAAAAVGLLFAKWGVLLLVDLLAGVRGRIQLEPQFDFRVLAFMAGAAIVSCLLFSVAPTWHASRRIGEKRRVDGGSRFRTGNALVVVQISLSLVLLCGAALFIRSLRNLTELNPGFEREGVLTLRVDASLPRIYPALQGNPAVEEHARLGRMWETMIAPLTGVPQVNAAAVSTLSPMSGRDRGVLLATNEANPPRDRGIAINQVSSGYFPAFGMEAVAGRLFTPADQAGSQRVAILNEQAVKARFPDGNPLGRRVNFPGQSVTAEYEIVGVVRDVRYESLRKAAKPMVYIPIQQAIDRIGGVNVAIRGRTDGAEMLPVLRRQVREGVPDGYISGIMTVQQQVDETLVEERLLSILASLFGGLALLLAVIGIYGVMAFAVIRRTREIGIRIAVGAPERAILWLVLRDTIQLVGFGLLLGIPSVWMATTYIEGTLFGLQGNDPGAISMAVILMLLVAVGAAALPAWRASHTDPLISLRTE